MSLSGRGAVSRPRMGWWRLALGPERGEGGAAIASWGIPFLGFSNFRQEEIHAPPGLSIPSPPLCSRSCAPPQSHELTGRASCFGMAVRGFAGPESATGFGVSALPAIDGHPDKQSFRGSRSRASSPQSQGSKEKDSTRVGEVRAACRWAGKSVVTLSRSSLLTLSRSRTYSKYRGDRSGPPPHPRFRSVHWRLVAGAANAFGRAYPAGSASHEEELASERRR